MKKYLEKLIFVCCVFAILGACQKDSAPNYVAPAAGSANSSESTIIMANATFEGLNGYMDGYLSLSGLKAISIGTCPTITATLSTSFPINISLDWGTGCSSALDTTIRSGKLYISLSGKMNVPNSIATFTFSNFVSNGNVITGTHRITYIGLNAGNSWPRYQIFTEAKIEFPDKKSMTYRTEYVRLQSEGSATATLDDDVYRIEGSSSGTTREGATWAANFPSALVKKNSCKWFSSGSVLITPQGELARTINFGDGTCDNKATMTIGDKTSTITL